MNGDSGEGDGTLLRTILESQQSSTSTITSTTDTSDRDGEEVVKPTSTASSEDESDSSRHSVSYKSSGSNRTDSSDKSSTMSSGSDSDSDSEPERDVGITQKEERKGDSEINDKETSVPVSVNNQTESSGQNNCKMEIAQIVSLSDSGYGENAGNGDAAAIEKVAADNEMMESRTSKKTKRTKKYKSAKSKEDRIKSESVQERLLIQREAEIQSRKLKYAQMQSQINSDKVPTRHRRKVMEISPRPISNTLYKSEPVKNEDKLHIKYLELLKIFQNADKRAYEKLKYRVNQMYGAKVNKFTPVESLGSVDSRDSYNYVRVHSGDCPSTDRSSRDEFVLMIPSSDRSNVAQQIRPKSGKRSRNKDNVGERVKSSDSSNSDKREFRKTRSNLEARYKEVQKILTDKFENENDKLTKNQIKQAFDVVAEYRDELARLEEEKYDDKEPARARRFRVESTESESTTPRQSYHDDRNNDITSTSESSLLSASKKVTFSVDDIEEVKESREWSSKDDSQEVEETRGRSKKKSRHRPTSAVSKSDNTSFIEVNVFHREKMKLMKENEEKRVRDDSPEKVRYGSDHKLAETDNELIRDWLKKKNKQQKIQKAKERAKKRKEREELDRKARERLEREEAAHNAMVGWMKRKSDEEKLLKKRDRQGKDRLKRKEERRKAKEAKIKDLHDDSCKAKFEEVSSVNFHAPHDCTCGFKEAQELRRQYATNAEVAKKLSHGGRPRSAYVYQKPPLSKKKAAKLAMEEEKKRRDELLKKRIAYDQWLKDKRGAELKKKCEDKKAASSLNDDPELAKIIPDLAKGRREKLENMKRKVDSGLPDIDDKANSYPKGKEAGLGNIRPKSGKKYVWKEVPSNEEFPNKDRPPAPVPRPPSGAKRSPRVVKTRPKTTDRHCKEIPDEIAESHEKSRKPTVSAQNPDGSKEESKTTAKQSTESPKKKTWSSPTPLRQSAEERSQYAEYINNEFNFARPEPQGCDRPEEVPDENLNGFSNSDSPVLTPPPTPPGKKKVSFGASKLIYTMDDTPSGGSSDTAPSPPETVENKDNDFFKTGDNETNNLLNNLLDEKLGDCDKNLNEAEPPEMNTNGFFITASLDDESGSINSSHSSFSSNSTVTGTAGW